MDQRLEQALAENRRRIVKRVLEHCEYRVDAPDTLPLEQTSSCRKLERELISEGLARHEGFSLRCLWIRLTHRPRGNCPSRWSMAYLAAWRRRHST